MISLDPFVALAVFVFGAAIGSFLNVVILRLPQPGASIVFPGSHCPHCKHRLRWRDNIPLLSFIMLRGRCAYCRAPVSFQYPVVEALTALLALANAAVFGISVAALGYFVFCAALVTIIWIDIHHQIIPDVISLPGIGFGLLFSFVSPLVTWQDSLIGAVVGFGIFYAISLAYYLLRGHDGLGGGDVKLLAMLGAFLGYKSLLFIIFVSSFTGTIAGLWAMRTQKLGGRTRIPFGPFLCVGAMLYLFLHTRIDALWHWYISLLA
ncbi:MAG: prepilin peptidase [Desulfofustis sp. PB-SRB1]|nr:prepilin peptidase [Desulfofustis sp. PB-SRB1]MBM1001709.1 prepilin peptidase [Desulfofustis sp. PB-SRB1]